MEIFDAIVLAGGAARRFDGVDKTRLEVAGSPLLDRVLRACAGAAATVVVGPERPTCRPVTWAREEPPGGGPVPALAAGLAVCTSALVIVLAADLPFVTPAVVAGLIEAVGDRDGARLVDAGGHDQPLTAAYRAAPLAAALAVGGPGAPLRRTLAPLDLAAVTDVTGAALDCDTPDELRAARERAREDVGHGRSRRTALCVGHPRAPAAATTAAPGRRESDARDRMSTDNEELAVWLDAVRDYLGLTEPVDVDAVLDLARAAAHGVARPAAPLTTFLAGYALGRGGREAGPLLTELAALADSWPANDG